MEERTGRKGKTIELVGKKWKEMERNGEKRGENIARKDCKPFCNPVSHTPKLGAARLRLSSVFAVAHAPKLGMDLIEDMIGVEK